MVRFGALVCCWAFLFFSCGVWSVDGSAGSSYSRIEPRGEREGASYTIRLLPAPGTVSGEALVFSMFSRRVLRLSPMFLSSE